MSDSLETHRDYLLGEWRGAQAAPLSLRKAALVAALLDAYVDRQFAADPDADDILAFRRTRAGAAPALTLIMALASGQARLVIDAVPVPVERYGSLSVEDFMVSLYNDHSVQRVLLVDADGARHDMQGLLAEAVADLIDEA